MIKQYDPEQAKPNHKDYSRTSLQSNPMRRLYDLPVAPDDVESEKPDHRNKRFPTVRSYDWWDSSVEYDWLKSLRVRIEGIHLYAKLNETESNVKEQFTSILNDISKRDESSFFILEFDTIQSLLTSRRIETEIRNLFAMAKHIDLDPGMANEFSEGLEEAILKYGELALREIQELVGGEAIPFTIAAEALRYIGNTESTRFASERRELLEACLLQSRFMLVRDGAAAGLSYLDDPRSIPSLQRAIEREPHAELKNDLIEVLSSLQGTSAE